MLEPARHADVVVVGAGVAGLSAAHQLTREGVTTVVLEAAPYVGGRMSTEKVDGFRLDRTGQPLTTSYAELGRTPGLDGLVLHPFAPGILVHSEGRRYRAGEPGTVWRTGRGGAGAAGDGAADARTPGGRTGVGGRARGALSAARAFASAPRSMGVPPARAKSRASGRPAPLGGPLDQARLAAALARLAAAPPERLLARPDRPVLSTLTSRGLPHRTVQGFLRPLLSALLSDPELTTSSRCADLALQSFARGRLCLPEGGADTVPELLAASLPAGTVRTGVRVTSVSTTSVSTAEHGTVPCRAVVVATGARTAAELLPGLRAPSFHPVTVLHHTVDEPPLAEPALLLDADRRGPVAHTAVVSQVDPSRAPAGRALVTSIVLGAPPSGVDRAVRDHLAELYGTSTARWELLGVHHDPYAVPAMPPPHDVLRAVRVLAGLYVCGDHREVSSLTGALSSGRRVARAVLSDLGVQVPPASEPLSAAA
ncbi:NAD(P)/FAD-dependent oxidoreductase [Streptomyces sp. NPDC002004]